MGFFGKKASLFHDNKDASMWRIILRSLLTFTICFLGGQIIAEGIVILLHFPFGKNVFVGETFDTQTITLITYYGYIIVIGFTLLYWKFIEKKTFATMGLTKNIGRYFIGVCIGIILLMLSVGLILATGAIKYDGISKNADLGIILLFFGGFVVQGAAEEILCRGLVFYTLKEKTSVYVAIAVSTVVFILPHSSSLFAGKMIYSLLGIVNLILISIIFSLLTLQYKGIWVACGLHSIWNAILYSVLGLNLSGNEEVSTAVIKMESKGDTILNGGLYGIEASIITSFVLAIAVLVIWIINRKEIDR